MKNTLLWVEAKGKLKAIVAAEGANISNVYTQGKMRYQVIEEVIDKFIDEFESEGYHE